MPQPIAFNEYRTLAMETASYEPIEGCTFLYPALGLAGEIGEVLEKVKKIFRDDDGEITYSSRYALVMELGDVMWFVTALLNESSRNNNSATIIDLMSQQKDIPFHIHNNAAALALKMDMCAGRVSELTLSMLTDSPSPEAMFKQQSIINFHLGAIVQCVQCLSDLIDVPFEEILAANIQKLKYRRDNGKLGGSGDYR